MFIKVTSSSAVRTTTDLGYSTFGCEIDKCEIIEPTPSEGALILALSSFPTTDNLASSIDHFIDWLSVGFLELPFRETV